MPNRSESTDFPSSTKALILLILLPSEQRSSTGMNIESITVVITVLVGAVSAAAAARYGGMSWGIVPMSLLGLGIGFAFCFGFVWVGKWLESIDERLWFAVSFVFLLALPGLCGALTGYVSHFVAQFLTS